MSLEDSKAKKTVEKKETVKKEEAVKDTPIIDGDIDLSMTRKKVFRINGDASRLVEINPSDMGVLGRLTDSYPKLQKLEERAVKMSQEVANGDDFDEVKLAKELKSIDKEMRKIIDTIFDSNISEVCAPDGTMFDPFNGKCRYEYIINAIAAEYDTNISKEAAALSDNANKFAKGK